MTDDSPLSDAGPAHLVRKPSPRHRYHGHPPTGAAYEAELRLHLAAADGDDATACASMGADPGDPRVSAALAAIRARGLGDPLSNKGLGSQAGLGLGLTLARLQAALPVMGPAQLAPAIKVQLETIKTRAGEQLGHDFSELHVHIGTRPPGDPS